MTRTFHLRRAFTMIELIVVVLVLTIVAGAILPRFVGNDERATAQEASRVRDYLSAVGVRSALTTQDLALAYVAKDRRLTVQSIRNADDPADFSKDREWLTDPVTPVLTLERLSISAVFADGQSPGGGTNGGFGREQDFQIVLPSGSARPAITFILSRPDQESSWRVDLARSVAHATVMRAAVADLQGAPASAVIDLDDAGLGETPW